MVQILDNKGKYLTFPMPTPTSHRNHSSNSQCKLVEWSQRKKSVDMKKANRNEISKPMSSNKQLMATTYKYSNNNNNK